jgi:hypothetical protein
MKSFLTAASLSIASFFLYKYYGGGAGSAPLVIDEPVFAQMRASVDIHGREIEMAVFVRSASMAECEAKSQESWSDVLESCPTCRLQTPKCQEQLPSRYARLFDDEPIPSAYLSASAGNAAERDGRIVVYGLTDAEGVQFCEGLRTEAAKKYQGELRCIPPSGS